MCSAVLEVGRFADIYEFCFPAAKLSDMDCFEVQWRLFVDCQELRFHFSKRLGNSSTILQEGRFADIQE